MKLDDHSTPSQVSAQKAPIDTAEIEEDLDDELVEADPTAWGQDLLNLQENMEAKHAADHAKTEWGKDLVSLQGSMEAKHTADHAKRSQEATFWAKGLVNLQAQFEAKLHNRKAEHLHEHHQEHKSDADGKLISRIVELGQEMCSKISRRNRTECQHYFHNQPQVNTSVTTNKSSVPHKHDQHLLEQMMAFGREMCLEPFRRGRPECRKFLDKHGADLEAPQQERNLRGKGRGALKGATPKQAAAWLKDQIKHANDESHDWEQHTLTEIGSLGHQLCNDPSRWDYPSCAAFRKSQESTDASNSTHEHDDHEIMAPATSSPSRFLSWRSVADWSKTTHSGPLRLTRSELMHGKWSGAIPKVACVALVPSGKPLKAWLTKFVDNFRLQNYEGLKQLVLVYDHHNRAAAKLLERYADGTFIKGAPSLSKVFPSAEAFRFGAWLSDADVVARWDFDAWHHPQRLTLQVRALAHSQRPASLLTSWKRLHNDGNTEEETQGERWDGSMVGEASWMRKNWLPNIGSAPSVSFYREREVANVDAHGLLVFNDE